MVTKALFNSLLLTIFLSGATPQAYAAQDYGFPDEDIDSSDMQLPVVREEVEVSAIDQTVAEVEAELKNLRLTMEYYEPTDDEILRIAGLVRFNPALKKAVDSYSVKGKYTFVATSSMKSAFGVGLDIPLPRRFSVIPLVSVPPLKQYYGAAVTVGYKLGSSKSIPLVGRKVPGIDFRAVTGYSFSRLRLPYGESDTKYLTWVNAFAGIRISGMLAPPPITEDVPEGGVEGGKPSGSDWKTYLGYYLEVDWTRRHGYFAGHQARFAVRSTEIGIMFNVGKLYVKLNKPIPEVMTEFRAALVAEEKRRLALPKPYTCAAQLGFRSYLCESGGWDDNVKLTPRDALTKKAKLARLGLTLVSGYAGYQVGKFVHRKVNVMGLHNKPASIAISALSGYGMFKFGLNRAKEFERTYVVGYGLPSRYAELGVFSAVMGLIGAKVQ